MNGIKLFYDFEKEKWILDTPVVLRNIELERITSFAFNIYKKRISGEIGPRRKRMQEALTKLSYNNIQQVISGQGEKTLWFSGKY